VPGHISDQLCHSLGNSSQWLITSEWESSEPFLAWVDSPAQPRASGADERMPQQQQLAALRHHAGDSDPLTGRPEPSGGATSRGRLATAAEAPCTTRCPLRLWPVAGSFGTGSPSR